VKRVSFLFVLLSLGILIGCGGSNGGGNNNPPPPPPPPVTLQSISVSTTLGKIAPGTTTQFVATGTFSDGSTQILTSSVTWNSATPATATISNTAGTNGLAQGVAAGTTAITAKQGTVTSSGVTLTVSNASIASIALTPASQTIDFGTQQQFTATGTFSDGTTQDISNVCTWSSGTTNVATVTKKSGLASSNQIPGSSIITATFNGTPGNTTLSVTLANLASITVAPGTATIAQGTQLQFGVTGLFNDGRTLNLTNLAGSLTSDDTTVATISFALALERASRFTRRTSTS